MNKSVTLSESDWGNIVRRVKATKDDCEYLKRNAYLSLEDLEQQIEQQLNTSTGTARSVVLSQNNWEIVLMLAKDAKDDYKKVHMDAFRACAALEQEITEQLNSSTKEIEAIQPT